MKTKPELPKEHLEWLEKNKYEYDPDPDERNWYKGVDLAKPDAKHRRGLVVIDPKGYNSVGTEYTATIKVLCGDTLFCPDIRIEISPFADWKSTPWDAVNQALALIEDRALPDAVSTFVKMLEKETKAAERVCDMGPIKQRAKQ